MRLGKAFFLVVLSPAWLAAVAAVHEAAAKPGAPAWTVARPRLTCGEDAAGAVSACRIDADVTRAPGAAERGVATVIVRDAGGQPLGCWDGGPLAASATATPVYVLAPREELGRARSFEVFVSSWGCWGTPELLGPRVRVNRAAAARDAAVVDAAREAARIRRDAGDADDHADPANGLELGPVVPGAGGADGC